MNSEFKDLEQQLSELRPARLPAPVRRNILQAMERRTARRRGASWLFAHRAGFQVALASALSLALVMSSHWMTRIQQPSVPTNEILLATSNALVPSLASLESCFGATSQIGINSVPIPRSALLLTNSQMQR